MAINYWRYLSYEGDGVSSYQCLNCYDEFQNLHSDWKYCPICGTRWIGKWPDKATCDERQRMQDLIVEASNRVYDRRKLEPHWIMEFREVSQWGDEPIKETPWYPMQDSYRNLYSMTAATALAELQHQRRVYADDTFENNEDNMYYKYRKEFRLVRVRPKK